MVRLHISLLALTFATGLVIASSNDYQRRDDELFERDFDYDLLNERSDAFDELEERSLFGGLFKIGEKIGEKAIKGRVGMALKGAKTVAKLEHHGGTKRIVKQVKSARRVGKKLKPSKKVMKQIKRVAKQAKKQNKQNKSNQNRINQDLERARKEVADADRYLPQNQQYHIVGRGLEDDEELSLRDLEAEDIFEREYDLFDERDTFDDLD